MWIFSYPAFPKRHGFVGRTDGTQNTVTQIPLATGIQLEPSPQTFDGTNIVRKHLHRICEVSDVRVLADHVLKDGCARSMQSHQEDRSVNTDIVNPRMNEESIEEVNANLESPTRDPGHGELIAEQPMQQDTREPIAISNALALRQRAWMQRFARISVEAADYHLV